MFSITFSLIVLFVLKWSAKIKMLSNAKNAQLNNCRKQLTGLQHKSINWSVSIWSEQVLQGEKIFHAFFSIYLVATRPALEKWRGVDLTYPTVITAQLPTRLEGQRKHRSEIESQNPVEHSSEIQTEYLQIPKVTLYPTIYTPWVSVIPLCYLKQFLRKYYRDFFKRSSK